MNEGEPAGCSAEVAGRIVDAFEMKRNAEQNFENGAVKFALSLKIGLHFFIENGFTTCDARKCGSFFLVAQGKVGQEDANGVGAWKGKGRRVYQR